MAEEERETYEAMYVSARSAVSYLTNTAGVNFSPEMQELINAQLIQLEKQNIVQHAKEILEGNGKQYPGKLKTEVNADNWVEVLFDLAAAMARDFKNDSKFQVGFLTPNGQLLIQLKR